MFIVSASGGQTHNFGQILTFWGLLCQPPFTDESQIWCAVADERCTRLRAKFRLGRFILLLSGGEKVGKPQFLPFFGLRYLVVSPVGSSLGKLNTDAQLQTFPYPTASKSFLYPQRLHGEIGRTISDVQKLSLIHI